MSSKLSGDLTGAAKTALANPPKGTKKSSNKTASCDVFLQVVKKARDADIEKIVSSLNQEELETALKYCYRAMSNYKDCAAVLKWHGAIFAKGGHGIVVRALTDRKTII